MRQQRQRQPGEDQRRHRITHKYHHRRTREQEPRDRRPRRESRVQGQAKYRESQHPFLRRDHVRHQRIRRRSEHVGQKPVQERHHHQGGKSGRKIYPHHGHRTADQRQNDSVSPPNRIGQIAAREGREDSPHRHGPDNPGHLAKGQVLRHQIERQKRKYKRAEAIDKLSARQHPQCSRHRADL